MTVNSYKRALWCETCQLKRLKVQRQTCNKKDRVYGRIISERSLSTKALFFQHLGLWFLWAQRQGNLFKQALVYLAEEYSKLLS